MSCKISSQISSRLRQLPLNLKIKKEVVLQLLTAVRGRNGKRKKKEGMMLPNISSQMEVGSLGGWPDAAGTSEHWMSNSTPCLDTSFSRLVAGIPQQEWQRLVVHTYTSVCCLACSRLHHGKTFSLLVFFFFSFSEWNLENLLSWNTQLNSVCHAWFLMLMCQISQQVVTLSCNPGAWEIDPSLLLLPHGMGEHDGAGKSCCH